MAQDKNNRPDDVDAVSYPDSVEIARKTGRKSVYIEDVHVPLAQAVALLGGTDEVSAKIIGINVATLYRWKAKHKLFRDAIESGKAAKNEKVEDALLRRAQGYTVKEEKVFVFEGEVVRTMVDKVYPPDPKAMVYWLNNRKGKYWKERHEVHVDTDITLKFDKDDEKL